jgi:hypothetical protein
LAASRESAEPVRGFRALFVEGGGVGLDLAERLGLRKNVQKEPSLDQQIEAVRSAWYEYSRNSLDRGTHSWISEVYEDSVIICHGEEYFRVPYTRNDDEITFDVEGAVPVERTWTEVAKTVVISKTDDDRQVAFGWAYVTKKADGTEVTDHSGEFIENVEILEDAAYVFNLHYREGDERHTETVKAHLVESFVSTPEKLEKMGLTRDALPEGWWTGWYIPDAEMFAKVKSGEYSMLSIGGTATKVAVNA